MANRFGDTDSPEVNRFGDSVNRFGDTPEESSIAAMDANALLKKQGLSAKPIPKVPKSASEAITQPGASGTTKGVMEALGQYGENRLRFQKRATGLSAAMAAPGGSLVEGAASGVLGYTGEKAAEGELPTVGGTLGAAAAGGAVPAIAKVASALKGAFTPNSRVASARVFRPTPSDPDFTVSTPQALGAIKKSNKGVSPTGITNGELDVIPAANKAIEEHQSALGRWIDRAENRGVKIPGDEIVGAVRDAIPSLMWQKDPEAARSIVTEAQKTWGGQSFGIGEFRQFLREYNTGLSPFYKKAPSAQAAAEATGTPTAIEKAEGNKVRELLYRYLDPENNGANPRTIQAKTGEIIGIRDAALKRNNSIIAEQPVTPAGAAASHVRDAISNVLPSFMVPPGWTKAATGLAYAEGQQGRSLPMLKKAFRGAEEPNALPLPESPLYPMGNAQRQLPPPIPPGPGVRSGYGFPPAPDTSGINGPSNGPIPTLGHDIGARALPPPSRFQMPGQSVASQTEPVFQPGRNLPDNPQAGKFVPKTGVQDMVPVRNPKTGKIEYIPKWMMQDVHAIDTFSPDMLPPTLPR